MAARLGPPRDLRRGDGHRARAFRRLRHGRGLCLHHGAQGRRARAAWRDHGPEPRQGLSTRDRKSTRLNSSHLVISYAVFCLKEKLYPIRQLHTPITQLVIPTNSGLVPSSHDTSAARSIPLVAAVTVKVISAPFSRALRINYH